MKKQIRREAIFVVFLLFAIGLTLASLPQTKVWLKQAAGGPPEVILSSLPRSSLPRIWNNFSQGGEEKGPSLLSVEKEIKMLQPQFIRIDHLFDFPSLDERVAEIIRLGATPFLSLSYFPAALSSEPTLMPASLSGWGDLVAKTIQHYSGQQEKALLNVYYEVWNEPDLFGQMNPQTYFSLYRVSVEASQKCVNCLPFKIGGPAITGLKKSWMNDFLSLVSQNQTRLDFISWHSYQLNPAKTLQEVETLRSLAPFANFSQKELLVTEWGSLPEISGRHDAYSDAYHVLAGISILKNSLSKIFSFELKDGPSPEGKKYWGRWGLLTHESFGITPKPRYYTFLYLNKLLTNGLDTKITTEDTSALGSTDAKENYAILFGRGEREAGTRPLTLKLLNLPPGLYTTNLFSLQSNQDPLTPLTNQISFNGGEFKMDINSLPSSVHLLELTRTSPSLVKAPGRTENPADYAARLTSFLPPLVFPFYLPASFSNGRIEFWFKPNWGENDNLIHLLWESKDQEGKGLSAWVEPKGLLRELHFSLQAKDQRQEEVSLPISWLNSQWHHLIFTFDKENKILALQVDDQQISSSLETEIGSLGNALYFGATANNGDSAEGNLDDLTIIFDGVTLYQKTFN